MNAYTELLEELRDDEVVESIVFGEWGWGGFLEPEDNKILPENQGVLLTLDQAKPLMQDWSFHGGYGSPECYATYIWTNKRVMWVTQYDGSTTLSSMPRNPEPGMPYMSGG